MADKGQEPAEGGQEVTGGLSHLDDRGQARMVDVGDKPVTTRTAVARGRVNMQAATLALIREDRAAKGDVLAAARLAGIMAAKKTDGLIPLCHPLQLTSVAVELAPVPGEAALDIEARVATVGKTGAEMEALTAVAVAALTVYDMCKAVDRGMTIGDIRLVAKSGGRSGTYRRQEEEEGVFDAGCHIDGQ